MESLYVIMLLQIYLVSSEIRGSNLINKLSKFKPVGGSIAKKFVPLTEIPPPHVPHSKSGRRHLEDDCTQKPPPKVVYEGNQIDIMGDYYDDRVAKTVATVIIPDHIDYKHFQVTTQVPYLTLGTIEAIGYHPTTIRSEHPRECEKIYQDHIEELYSDETADYSEESLEMAKMPIAVPTSMEDQLINICQQFWKQQSQETLFDYITPTIRSHKNKQNVSKLGAPSSIRSRRISSIHPSAYLQVTPSCPKVRSHNNQQNKPTLGASTFIRLADPVAASDAHLQVANNTDIIL